MEKPSSTKSFINWMYATKFEDLPAEVRRMAGLALYDGIGCTLACSLLPVAHRMMDFVIALGGLPDCSVIGFPARTSVVNAALVNGTLGHADEVDAIDDVTTRGSHVLASTMAAALTAGQQAGASGQEVLRAVVLGYELSKRVHAVAARVQRERGMTGAFDEGNTLGAAAAAGISLGLTPEQMEIALGLAGYLACGITPFRREANHMAKSFTRGGMGAKNGVTAALMAKVGYDAPQDILDGPQGFFDSYLGVENGGPEFLAGLSQDFSILGLTFKRQSSGVGLQTPRQAILEVMAENELASEDIEEILVEMRPADISSYFSSARHPADCGDALALASIYGGMGFLEAHLENLAKSPRVKKMRDRIKVQPREDWQEAGHRLHTVVNFTLKDGRTLRKEAEYRRMSEEDLDAKFSYLVGLRAGNAKAEELAQVLKRLDAVSNISDVMVQLELPQAQIEQVYPGQDKLLRSTRIGWLPLYSLDPFEFGKREFLANFLKHHFYRHANLDLSWVAFHQVADQAHPFLQFNFDHIPGKPTDKSPAHRLSGDGECINSALALGFHPLQFVGATTGAVGAGRMQK